MRSSLSMLSKPLNQCIWHRSLYQSNEPLSGLVIRLVYLDQCIWHRSLYQSNEPLSGLVIRLVHLQRSLCTSIVYKLTCPQCQRQHQQQSQTKGRLVIAQLTAVLMTETITIVFVSWTSSTILYMTDNVHALKLPWRMERMHFLSQRCFQRHKIKV